MLNIQQIKNLLKQNDIAVLKKFGQNFLISENILNKIIETANIKLTDTVLEIGPGLGVLTFELAKKAGKVVAIEKDRKFFEIIKKNLETRGIKNVFLVNDNALAVAVETRFLRLPKPSFNSPYKLVANLPYNIATAVIIKFLESENPPQQIIVMVQKEVAQRICATPPHMNKLAIFCQLYSVPKIVSFVPPSAFWPKPKVDSAIIALYPRKELNSFLPKRRSLTPSFHFTSQFQQIVNAGFSHPRKTLLNNLIRGLPSYKSDEGRPRTEISQWLLENNIQPNQRPETMSIHNWLCLAKTFKT